MTEYTKIHHTPPIFKKKNQFSTKIIRNKSIILFFPSHQSSIQTNSRLNSIKNFT